MLPFSIPLFPGTDFQEHYANREGHSLLNSRDLLEACKSMYHYIVEIGKKRFPEIGAFLDPHMRNLQQPDIPTLINRFSREGPITFSSNIMRMQFCSFQMVLWISSSIYVMETMLISGVR